MQQIIYKRPQLADYQKAIIDSDKRYTVTVASTKAGKTASHILWLFEKAILNKNVRCWWVAPIHNQAKIAFERLNKIIQSNSDLKNIVKKTLSSSGTQAIYFINDSVIEFKSADNADSLYGQNVNYAVCDEYTRFEEKAWVAVRSTLTNTRGHCKLIGNVTTRNNWGYQLLENNKNSENWETFIVTAHDAVRNGIMKQEELDDARNSLPEIDFKALYLCEPVNDGSNPFNFDKIKENTIDKLSTKQAKIYGIDIASTVDFTVICGLDEDNNVCFHQKFQGDYNVIISMIKALDDKISIILDSTGVGKPVYDILRKETNKNIVKFNFTQNSRKDLLSNLASVIHQNKVKFTKVYADNLSLFKIVSTHTSYSYRVNDNQHDDETMALALACYYDVIKQRPTSFGAINAKV